jgi:hypothetical protein
VAAGSPAQTAASADRRFTPGLADVLERVLDKGIVIAGDIRVNLLDIELLTIKIRLLVASVDKAREMGIDWWEHDPTLSVGQPDLAQENQELRTRLAELESGAAGNGHRAEALPESEAGEQESPAQPAGSPTSQRRRR